MFPVIDLHCDLTAYLIEYSDADPDNEEAIGCAIPHLKKGNVKIQVCAFFTGHMPMIFDNALKQSNVLSELIERKSSELGTIEEFKDSVYSFEKIILVPAIENASGICHEDENLNKKLKQYKNITEISGTPYYISLTHLEDNRFGGAAGTKTGLKDDGKVLIDFLSSSATAFDFSHASDKLIEQMLTYLDSKQYKNPVMASHSNFRSVWNHQRNLPDELAKEIIARDGLIGINFMRNYMHTEKPYYILKHIDYGLQLGAENNLAFGADFFHDRSRLEPIYHDEHKNASRYPEILESVADEFGKDISEKIAWKNTFSRLKTFVDAL